MYLISRFVLIGALAAVPACTSAGSTPTAPSSSGNASSEIEAAAGTTWTLRSFTDAQGKPVSLPQGATFSIAFSDGRLSIQSDCNRCTGSATLDANSLDVGLLACTRAYCSSEPVASQFEGTLQGRHTVAVQGTRLTLTSPRAVLGFTR
jgi:heat shock protein HslJ